MLVKCWGQAQHHKHMAFLHSARCPRADYVAQASLGLTLHPAVTSVSKLKKKTALFCF